MSGVVDWKKVAAERLEKIRVHERRWKRLHDNLERELYREISKVIHARCLTDNGVSSAMAKFIAKRLAGVE